ncbi:ABL162Cp [Eremothecium gossypii ATCC 10895]|uniref:Serine/threonine-protein phosphatase 4 regulatory subunit 3 n=1 Tax=Eremothecium gossypii (strain ATCC 10895 / CBS 109.51 / FGSC 9923 / NRRL Y-1056) TaxID=284811 RepID=PP4R3_EREGS|nr:ABL162Cp [Eremothecium gossypii ATCC 10895]Q75E32.2 RecName: Full=Serine/threonine-protein phosphatase 4 regulatory subunit 3; Short=PP4R3 [Eremothecium gossypii ATCC 10895]AAS50609.2 ABL162Cp [Eremothecium gossypii ATCC 10895]AEY94897.1 FABL162Cp [Eremothecium gossypii FDAG1]
MAKESLRIGVASTEPKRVKVYILEDNEWRDTGTGFCTGQCEQDKPHAYLLVRDEEQPERVLLKSKLEGNIEYQRQEETLIVWKDLQGQDIALSFEESTGCNALCEFICLVQKTFENNISLVSVRSNDDGMGSVHEIITGPVHLPSNDPQQNEETLMESLRILNENTSFEFLKNETVDFILNTNYLHTLINHFHIAEEKLLHKDLLLLSHIIKTLFLYNEREVLEQLIDDKHYMGVVGILEYDTDFPDCKASHRKCLQGVRPKFQEVIPLNDENMRQTINKTFRLQFLKDVVLIRFLDDHAFNLITDVMLTYQTTIIRCLQEGSFIDDLVNLYTNNADTSDSDLIERKRQGIRLLDECVQISCNLDPPDRSIFYKVLVKKGLFNVLDFAFNVETNSDIRILATDMIISIIEYDILLINSVRNEVDDSPFAATNEDSNINTGLIDEGGADSADNNCNGNSAVKAGESNGAESPIAPPGSRSPSRHTSDISLLLILSKILLTDQSPGLKEQAFQALITLLDPEDFMGEEYEDQSNLESLMKFYANSKLREKPSTPPQFQLLEYFTKFYEQVAPVLFQSFISGEVEGMDDQLLLRLVKLVDLLIHEHDIMLSRGFILENGILLTIGKLMEPSHIIQLRLAAVRCIKGIVAVNDEFYHNYLISKNLFDPICQLLQENLYFDNMANSCVLDLFKVISARFGQDQEYAEVSTKNFLVLNQYLVERFGPLLEKVDYVPYTSSMIQMSRVGRDAINKQQDNNGERNTTTGGEADNEEFDVMGAMDSSLASESDGENNENNEESPYGGAQNSKRSFSDIEDNTIGVEKGNPEPGLPIKKLAEEISESS